MKLIMDENNNLDPGAMWSHRITQFLFTCAVVISFVIFWYAGHVLGIPAETRHGGSLLRQPTIGDSILALIAGLVLLGACTLLCSAFLRNRWFLAPLSAATAGLSAWSMRGGPMQEVLLYAPSITVFIQLAAELLLLGAMVAAVWLFIWRPPGLVEEPLSQGPVATGVIVQALVMAFVVLLLTQTDAKKQCVAAVFIAGLVSATTAQSFCPGPRSARWYWIGPIAVGLAGYLLAAMSGQGWSSGSHELDGFWAPLARPLPLDYASAGMLGVLIGYWMSIPESQDEAADEPNVAESGTAAT
jgi:hypothetical protein